MRELGGREAWELGGELVLGELTLIETQTQIITDLTASQANSREKDEQEGGGQEPTDTSKQPIRTRYLGHVTGYHPIKD